jgi:diguanylate cyclase (GGDEF)-like protein
MSQLGWTEAAVVVLLLVGTGLSVFRRWKRRAAGGEPRPRDEVALGAHLLALTFLTVAVAGAELFPIVYLLMAFLVGFLSLPAAATLWGIALVFDAVLTLGPTGANPVMFGVHALFLTLFALLYQMVLSARLALARRAENEAVHKRIKEVEEHARTFRLVSSGSRDSMSGGMKAQEKWLMASVKEIEGAVGSALEIAETALHTYTCAAFLLTSDDRHLKLHDCRSRDERVEREKFPAGEGILGGVLKRSVPVRMHTPAGLRGVTYREEGAPLPRSILVVPIVDSAGRAHGVLVADRAEPTPFTEDDERLLSQVAAQVLRAIEIERVMTYIRQSRDEKDRFFRAIEELNRAGNPEQVFAAVIESARQLASLDFCAVTIVQETDGKRQHRIAQLAGLSVSGHTLEGRTFDDNTGLVANVVRYGAPLPGREFQSMDRQLIFDDELFVRGLSAVKIFPLTVGERILGTLVAGTRKRTALDEEALRMLEILAFQAAEAVLRAQLFQQMETMATTDGLTGLSNHRTFQTKADEALAQARRYGRKCSLILTDIDHFKTVNDTYGHPIGDLVLKGVSRLLKAQARDTDIVARYGGEEFAVIMPETDAKGALVIAERIREAVAAEVFQTEMGPLKVTLSLGVATCPENGTEKQPLVDLVDQCLYFAKRNGRNRSITVEQMQGRRPELRARTG